MVDIGFRSTWTTLPLSGKLTVVLLTIVTVKTIHTSLRTLIALRDLHIVGESGSSSVIHSLRNRVESLRQLHVFTAFALWFSFSVLALDGFRSLELPRSTGVNFILENLRLCFLFSAWSFCLLILLHSLQWFVSSRLTTANRRIPIVIPPH